MIADILDPKLKGRGNPCPKRRPQPIRKAAADLLRGNKIEFRGLPPLGRREIDQIEFVLVHSQAKTFDVDAV